MERIPLLGKVATPPKPRPVSISSSRGPNAGITPPPGVYFQDDTNFYSGKISGTTLPTGASVVAS